MLRIERSPGRLTIVSRLARIRVLVVLAAVLFGAALTTGGSAPGLAVAIGLAGVLVGVLGARPMRARFERGRVSVLEGMPWIGRTDRPLAEFDGACVQSLGEARRRKADRRAAGWRDRAGSEMPGWLRAPEAPATNDALRRIVLVARSGEPVPVTSWLADGDLEVARAEVEAALR